MSLAKKIIIANWKMNPATLTGAKKLALGIRPLKSTKTKKVVIAPPFVFMPAVRKITGKAVKYAAQDAFWADSKMTGAYTGEVSSSQLKSMGVEYVIAGHSERREHLGESDEIVNKKVRHILKSGLKVVLCVGEKERKDDSFQNFVREELEKDLAGVSKKHLKNLIVAYEPIWAIGTGKAPRPDDLFEMTTYIRKVILKMFGKKYAYEMKVLYGGSVNAKNSGKFLEVEGVDGLLVGGASLKPKEFISIVRST